jgi:type II secretory pathway pseudopilin PulG
MKMIHRDRGRRHRGYILLELIIALSMFSIAVLGLTKALSNGLQTVNIANKDYAVRLAMRSFLEEIRRKPLADIPQTITDPATGAELVSDLTEVSIRSKQGRNFSDVKKLTITAKYTAAGQQQEDFISVLIYRTQDEDSKRRNQ